MASATRTLAAELSLPPPPIFEVSGIFAGMSSFQFVLGYLADRDVSIKERDIRSRHATTHLQHLVDYPLRFSCVGDERIGLMAWEAANALSCSWPQMVQRDNRSVAWLHYPYHDHIPVTNAFDLGIHLSENPQEISRFGAPLGVLSYQNGTLRIANDVLALARLMEFRIGDFTVWCSRSGLAHIFAGVPPEKNIQALSGLAAINWAVGGHSPIGHGRHLAAYTRITARRNGISREEYHSTWVENALRNELPSPESAASEMQACLRVSEYFPRPPIADLSGGKDSRVIAAAALTAGVTKTILTVDKDPGEVDTARRLVSVYPEDVEHRIKPVATRESLQEVELHDRLLGWATSHEGHMISLSAINQTPHRRRLQKAARLNGLGGEAMQGGNFAPPAWRERAKGKGIEFSLRRTQAMAQRIPAVRESRRDEVAESLAVRVRQAESMGLTSPIAHVGYIYLVEEMPYWSAPLAQREVLVPFFCAPLTRYMIHALPKPFEYGELHRLFLRHLIPAWKRVPFYRGSPATNRLPMLWERHDWPETQHQLMEAAENSAVFDPIAVADELSLVAGGQGGKPQHVAFSRILWEQAIETRRHEIGEAARATAQEVRRLHQASRDQSCDQAQHEL